MGGAMFLGALSFLYDVVASLASGKKHHSSNVASWTTGQRVIMVGSSLCYLFCAWTWTSFGHLRLGQLFCFVAVFSVYADGLNDLIPPSILSQTRIADRVCGSAGLILSNLINANSLSNGLVCLSATISALCVLAWDRRIARTQPHRRNKYLAIHSFWHVYGAGVVCGITFWVQGQQEGAD